MDYVRLSADDTVIYIWNDNLSTLLEEIKNKFPNLQNIVCEQNNDHK